MGRGERRAHTFCVTGLFLAGASTLLGAFFGLLFGIPKRGKRSATEDSSASVQVRQKLVYNTNLADISDWLTKALVGATLVEVRQIWSTLKSLFLFLGTSFSEDKSLGPLVAGSISVHYVVAGFFVGFFFASVVLRDVLNA
jgi:hypothetical protein